MWYGLFREISGKQPETGVTTIKLTEIYPCLTELAPSLYHFQLASCHMRMTSAANVLDNQNAVRQL